MFDTVRNKAVALLANKISPAEAEYAFSLLLVAALVIGVGICGICCCASVTAAFVLPFVTK